MKTWTILSIIKWTSDFFRKHDIENPRLEAELIVSHYLDINRMELYLNYNKPLDPSEKKKIKNAIIKRANHEPLQYILGEVDFFDLKLQINKNVLIPRPETEFLVDKIIKDNSSLDQILDLGTGSGAIALSLALNYPEADVVATDISKEAINTAIKNAHYNNIKNIKFVVSNLFNSISNRYSLIVSNPPYISPENFEKLPPEIKNFEPQRALVANKDGFEIIEKLIKSAKKYLLKKGLLYIEIGYNHKEYVEKVASKAGYNLIQIEKDLNGFYRYAKLGV